MASVAEFQAESLSSPSEHSPEEAFPAMPTTLSVVVCTYQRVAELARCLAALSKQTRLPDEVVVAVRETDKVTREYLAKEVAFALNLRVVLVRDPGVVAARNAALEAHRFEIMASLDDDAVPYPLWCERVLRHFQQDLRLGGLGGRDRCHNGAGFDDRKAAVVGKLQWIGRRIGNHHIGTGGPREVDVLKGANMSFRSAAIGPLRFDRRLKGSGAQPYEDIAFSLAIRRRGWKLMYDPEVLVDHYEGPRSEARYYSATIPVADAQGFRNFAYNGVVAVWEEFSPFRRAAFLVWSLLVGTRVCPGLVQAFRMTPRLGTASWKRFILAQQGIAAATWHFVSGRMGHAA